MRYYVLSEAGARRPYIVGEVVREFFDDGRFRASSFAAAFATEPSRIVTLDELLRDPAGTHALVDWRNRNDAAFNQETRELLFVVEQEQEALERRRGLRVVDGSPAKGDVVGARPSDAQLTVVSHEKENDLLLRVKMSIERAHEIVTVARKRQEERRVDSKLMRQRIDGGGRP